MSDERGNEMQAVYAHDSTGTRTDVHRPSAINPGDYEFVSVSEKRKARAEGKKIGGPAGTCHHCGKAIVWEVNYTHKPSGNLVTFGYICAGILDLTDNRIDHEMVMLKRRAENERRQEQWNQAKLDRHHEFVTNHPDLANFLDEWDLDDEPNGYISRIKWGVETYGSPAEWQMDGLRKFKAGRERFIEQRIEEAKLLENAPKLQDGRQVIEGYIMSIKYDVGDFSQTKMTVKTLDGNRVYGTMPAAISQSIDHDNFRDTKVRFTAAVTAKEDHFGYFNRPSKAEVL
jgi:hypothetical protein